MITIDELIAHLTELRNQSAIGGETGVFVCVQDEPYIEISNVKIDKDDDGACILLMPAWEPSKGNFDC